MRGDSTTMIKGDEHITLKVNLQDGGSLYHRIKRSTQLKKLMAEFCERKSLNPSTIAFIFDGRRLRPEHTPAKMEMEDGDEIDAMMHQIGGSTPA